MRSPARSVVLQAAALALALVAPPLAPAAAQESTEQPPRMEAPAAEAAPPPLVPAPDMPDADPLVELPPEGAAPPLVTPPGVPIAPGGQPFSFADLAEQLLDSVVYISTSQRVTLSTNTPMPELPEAPGEDFFDDFFEEKDGGGPQMVQSLGSGFVIDESGLIVTNNHVIADAEEIIANFRDGSKLTAEVLGIDDKTDLALLKVTSPAPLPAARFGRSEALRVGDWVLAIGNPFGFGGTVTAGIVSALERDINSGPYDHYIQTDASINRGNSGGPLFSLGGEVVGINTAIMSPTGGSIGIGFAVPSEIAVPVIEQLRQFGEVRRGWIGVRIQDVTEEYAEGLGMAKAMGALIAGLTEDGPAAQAGMRSGDVVVEFDGRPVETMRELPRLVADTAPGDSVEVTVVRDGERLTLPIEVGLLDDVQVAAADADDEAAGEEEAPVEADAVAMFGLTLGELSEEARETYMIDEAVEGVLVTAVEAGSQAEEKGVEPGNVVVQVSQTEVVTPEDVTARVDQLKAQGRRSVMLLVAGADDKLRFVSLRFEDR